MERVSRPAMPLFVAGCVFLSGSGSGTKVGSKTDFPGQRPAPPCQPANFELGLVAAAGYCASCERAAGQGRAKPKFILCGDSRSPPKGCRVSQGEGPELRGERVQCCFGARSEERRGVREPGSHCILSARLSERFAIFAPRSRDRPKSSKNTGSAWNLRKTIGAPFGTGASREIVSAIER